MSTQTLITTLNDDYFPTYSRAKLLTYLNRVQRWAYNHDCAQNVYLNTADPVFPVPFLNTTAGDLEYPIADGLLLDSDGSAINFRKSTYPVVCRSIRRVFIEATDLSGDEFDKKFYGEAFSWTGVSAYWSNRVHSTTFYEVPTYLFDKTDVENAKVVFAEDPGTSTNKYYVEFYHGPINLTSEAIPMTIDSDMWYELLISGVNAIVEDVENGTSTKWQEFAKYWKPQWTNNMNSREDQTRPRQTPIREVG